jgi:hypothetical protein
MNIKLIKKIELLRDKGTKEYFIFVNDRYAIYLGGMSAIYDTKEAKDIPQYIFEFKELLATIKI